MIRSLAAAGLMLAVVGCSAPGAASDTDGQENAPTEQSATQPETTADANQQQAPSAAPLQDPIGTREVVSDGNTYALDLFSLERRDDTVVLNARVRYVEVMDETVDNRLLAPSEAIAQVQGQSSGFRLVDTAAGKVYAPATYGEDRTTCTPQMPMRAATGDVAYFSCTFGAPESDTVEVTASRFGSFNDVPIR